MKIVNLSNQIGAGPSNISKIFIKECADKNHNVFFILTPENFKWAKKNNFKINVMSTGFIHYLGGLGRLICVNFLLIPFIIKTKPVNGIICFGNFLLL